MWLLLVITTALSVTKTQDYQAKITSSVEDVRIIHSYKTIGECSSKIAAAEDQYRSTDPAVANHVWCVPNVK
jgi:hypothetical protein